MAGVPPLEGDGTPGTGWLFMRLGGRIGRQLFLLGWLFLTALNGLFLSILLAQEEGSAELEAWSLVTVVAGMFALWASVALTVKRLHDIGKGGAFAVLVFVPLVSIVLLVVLALVPGTESPNRYGQTSDRP